MSEYWRNRVLREFEASSMIELLEWMKSQGNSLNRVAEMFEVSYHTVRREADILGVEFERWRQPRGRIGFRDHGNTRYFTIGGERLSMGEISRRSGIHRTTIKYRIDVMGWAPDKAVSTPVRAVGA